MIDQKTVQELARRSVGIALEVGAEQAEALAAQSANALTRFANNRIHQNVVETDTQVSVRAVIGTRTGVASTNRVDDEALRECCLAAVEAARSSADDSEFPGLPEPSGPIRVDRSRETTRSFSAQDRANAVRSMIEQSEERGLSAAGKVQIGDSALAIANSLGIDSCARTSSASATVLSMGPDGGSGWASFSGSDVADFAPEALGDQAAQLAERSAKPGDLEPGSYTVVLAPEAVSALVEFLGWMGFSAKAVAEGRSFMTGHEGERVMSPLITITDDALGSNAIGPTFDYEGVAKTRVSLIENGIAMGPVTDSYWAARTGRSNTGHALPAPNTHGPFPLDLEMAPGDSSIDDLIGSVEHGVYVTRFHYVNIEDPVPVVLTGMTRDGTFLIENGRLTRPLKNLRFTQSAVSALDNVRAVTSNRERVGDQGSSSLVPGLLIDGFAFTGQTG